MLQTWSRIKVMPQTRFVEWKIIADSCSESVCVCHCECLCVSLLAKQQGDCSHVFSPSAWERESFQPRPSVPLFHSPLVLSGAVSVRMRRRRWEGGGGGRDSAHQTYDYFQSKIQEWSMRRIFHWDYILYTARSAPTCTLIGLKNAPFTNSKGSKHYLCQRD